MAATPMPSATVWICRISALTRIPRSDEFNEG
jgi:hypothetical protein